MGEPRSRRGRATDDGDEWNARPPLRNGSLACNGASFRGRAYSMTYKPITTLEIEKYGCHDPAHTSRRDSCGRGQQTIRKLELSQRGNKVSTQKTGKAQADEGR